MVAAAARAAYDRFGVEVGEPTAVVRRRRVRGPPVLALRPVADEVFVHRRQRQSGKYALAASRLAAAALR